MHEALARIPGVKWLRRPDQPPPPPAAPTLIDEMTALVRTATGPKGAIDEASSTWIAVSHWAANELLSSLAELPTDDVRAAARNAKVKFLKELLALPADRGEPEFEEQGPHIP